MYTVISSSCASSVPRMADVATSIFQHASPSTMTDETNPPASGDSEAKQQATLFGITPPERRIVLPPSPPSTGQTRREALDAPTDEIASIVDTVARVARESSGEVFFKILLDQAQYKLHQKDIDRLFKRYDYDPDRGLLVIRMHSAIHECFLHFFVDIIKDQLKNIATSSNEASGFASEIRDLGSTTIHLTEDTKGPLAVCRDPDAQFQHSSAAYPGLVIEVSYSQNGKSLRKLAQSYILGSNGAIKVVIGIDLNRTGSASTISVWRSKFTVSGDKCILEAEQDVSYMPFRTADGTPINQQERLTIYLRDFATDEVPYGHDPVSLSIDFATLYRYLSTAEQMQHIKHSGIKSGRLTRKRRLSSSSAEALLSEDEAKFTKAGTDAARNAELGDED